MQSCRFRIAVLGRAFYPAYLHTIFLKSFQRNQLLSTGGMNGHTIIEIRLRRSHLHRDPETLQHLGAPGP